MQLLLPFLIGATVFQTAFAANQTHHTSFVDISGKSTNDRHILKNAVIVKGVNSTRRAANSGLPSNSSSQIDVAENVNGNFSAINRRQSGQPRCGWSWDDANSRCGGDCWIDNDCGEQYCFADLDDLGCDASTSDNSGQWSGPAGTTSIRCGWGWQSANDNFYNDCQIDGDCWGDMTCFNNLYTPTDSQTQQQPAPQPNPPAQPQSKTPTFSGSCYADNSCAYRATFDHPSGEGLSPAGCVAYANYARHLYNPGFADLYWDETLAYDAQQSAEYSAYYNCWDCHTNSGPGTTWGQNLFLGKYGCDDAYYGWVTNEALGLDPVNAAQGHFKNVIGVAAPYVSIGCGFSPPNLYGRVATVCNYGLYP